MKPGVLEWNEVAEPRLTDRSSALVRPLLASRSDHETLLVFNDLQARIRKWRLLNRLDTRFFQLLRKDVYRLPTPLGQECIAEVVETGPDVQGLSRGQKVIVPYQLACGRCACCAAGYSAHCTGFGRFDQFGGLGRTQRGGMVSDLLCVPNAARLLIKVPEMLDPVDIVAAGANLTDAWAKVVPELRSRPGARVLVVGGMARSTALYAVAFASAMQPELLDYIDVSSERVGIAAQLGANSRQIDLRSFRGEYDLVVCGSAAEKSVLRSLDLLRTRGVCAVLIAPPRRSVAVPLFRLYANSLTLAAGITHTLSQLPAMLDHLRTIRLKLGVVLTHKGMFDEADVHFLKQTTKVIVTRPSLY